ncbi:MAG TPA: response regulator [Terriglobia bacterium]|nr:response regulator [Terriglobia bacterium]
MIRRSLKSFISSLVDLGPRKRRSPAQPPVDSVTIVGLMDGDDEDGRLLADIGNRSGWNVVLVDTSSDAKAALDQAKAPVVLCDRELLGMGWRNAVERLAGPPNQACVIVLSETVDTYLWNEVVRSGGHDVLPKPLREEGVVRAVRLARTYWNSLARNRLASGRIVATS